MKLTKKVIAGVLMVGFLTTFLALPKAAEAGGGWHGHNDAAPFFGGLAVGAITGLIVGAAVAPRAVYAAPPVCWSYWVNPYWNGYQWLPGYWAQACR